jgi:monofunctional biosynthetic peptidoglycan transglycosylase
MSPYAKLSVIASEDQLFPDHNGFDFKSIEKAMKHNQKSKSLHGASTLSQQVAKNVFLWQGRSWIRKGMEVYFTFMIELVWGRGESWKCISTLQKWAKEFLAFRLHRRATIINPQNN